MAGSSDQWAALARSTRCRACTFARQWVPHRADAEDVVQEGFVRFWRSRERATDPAAYLYGCVKHCILDWQARPHPTVQARKKRRLARRPRHFSTVRWSKTSSSASVAAALRNLPENQREVLVMKIWGGLSFPQIAEGLRISANTAASRYRYALVKLREQLAEESIP